MGLRCKYVNRGTTTGSSSSSSATPFLSSPPPSLSLSSSSPSVDRGVGAGIASCVNKHGSPRPLVSLIQPGTRRGGDQRTDATLPSLSLSLMFFLEFYSLLSTLSMYRREQRLRYHHPTVERVGERVDPLEGESAPRYWTCLPLLDSPP